jgi:hypothetical protein
MILLGIEVYKSEESFSCDGIEYPPGTHIIPMSQPFALFVKNVFEEQSYPDLRKYPDLWQGLVEPKQFEGAPFESYDMMGWTLPYQFGVKVSSANTPLSPKMQQLEEVKPAAGKIAGKPDFAYLISPQSNVSFTAINRVFKEGGKVERATEPFSADKKAFPAGIFLISSSSVKSSFIEKLARELNLEIAGISEKPKTDTFNLKKVRLGVYKSWVSSEDEGWTRFVLESHEFPYTSIHDADIRAGNLINNFEAIIIPDSYSPEAIINGYQKGTMPPKYVGGITVNGIRNLKSFVEEGGTLIFFNSSCDLALENFDLPARNILKKVKKEEFICSGSILRVEFDTKHPLAFGMPQEAGTVFADSCVFDIMPSFGKDKEAKSAAKYPEENPLMSGWTFGDGIIRQKSAILDISCGKGKFILFGFPVQFRAQSYGTFKLLFNAVYYAGIK